MVAETGERGHKGYYHQKLVGQRQIEALEMRCLSDGRFLYERGPVRYYWFDYGEIIGASKGEQTTYVLIEYHQNGNVHGHPVTWQELRDKGANDEDDQAG